MTSTFSSTFCKVNISAVLLCIVHLLYYGWMDGYYETYKFTRVKLATGKEGFVSEGLDVQSILVIIHQCRCNL